MIEIEVNGQKYLFDDEKDKAYRDWYEKREQHAMWVVSGGMFGKEDTEK